MSKALVDTSVLTDALLKTGEACKKARAAIKRYNETETLVYAIKEFKAGPLTYFVWLHNKFASEGRYSNVLRAVQKLSRTPQRNRTSTALEALTILSETLGRQKTAGLVEKYDLHTTEDERRAVEARLLLKAMIYKAWAKRRRITTHVIHPLSCYDEGEISERRGAIELGAKDCTLEPYCCLRKELIAAPDDLKALRDVAELGSREEDKKRYRVLRHLCRTPNRELTSDMCRNLGDAIFAFFAEPNSEILTTNIKDHGPLANALGKTAVRP